MSVKNRSCKSTLKSIVQRPKTRRIFFTLIGLAVWCCIVLPVLYTFFKEPGSTNFVYSSGEPKSKLNIEMDLLSMDPATRTANMLVKLYPQEDFSSGDRTLTKNLTVDFLHKTLQLKSSTTTESIFMTIPFTTGFLRQFPADNYNSRFPIKVYTQDGTSRVEVPYIIKFGGAAQLFGINYEMTKAKDTFLESYQYYNMDPETNIASVTLKRLPSTIAICVTTTILMWGLVISLANVAWDGFVYNREITAPILGAGVVIIICLPGFRNLQPGIPSTLCTLDMLGFFWCLSLAVLSTSTIIFCWVFSWRPAFMVPKTESL